MAEVYFAKHIVQCLSMRKFYYLTQVATFTGENPSGFANVSEYPYSTTLSEEPRWTCRLYLFIACVTIC